VERARRIPGWPTPSQGRMDRSAAMGMTVRAPTRVRSPTESGCCKAARHEPSRRSKCWGSHGIRPRLKPQLPKHGTNAGICSASRVIRGSRLTGVCTATCKACKGEGHVKCPTCNGEGTRLIGFTNRECSNYSGSGIKKCGACGGSGRIPLRSNQRPPSRR